ncbi:MAG: PA-phosphatase-like phosphoesterase [Rhodocyclaceae bacterium]|nr:MAG: PA-phosphatase-like phosphoesterase [Rhodocyclaceae bacterium]TND00165.1 MAG: PA-phosphatase-like phosphoesterase [Rhodocyclaceae bacterium]
MIVPRSAIQAALWWSAALGTLAGGAAWIRAAESGRLPFDHEALILANAWRSPWLDGVFLSLTWLGSLWILLPLVLAAGTLLWHRGYRREARFIVVALVGATLLARLVKDLTLRPRPDLFAVLTPVGSEFSFPSAHAAQVTALAAALWLVAVRLTPQRRQWLIPLLLVMVALVDFSRLYLQVHYPSDVLTGTIAAACWVLGLSSLLLRDEPAADT